MERDRSDRSVCMKGGGILFIGVNIAFIFLHIAMLCFHGGNRFSLEPDRFRFTENFLSELGSIKYWDGSLNITSRILFNFGILFAVICFICYLRHFPGNFLPHTPSRKISTLGNICSFIAFLGFIGVLCVPNDLHRIVHLILMLIAFGGTTLIFLCFGIAGLISRQIPRILTYLFLVLFLGLLSYFFSMILGPNLFTEKGAHFHIFTQKLGVSFLIIVLDVIGWITFRSELRSKVHLEEKSKNAANTSQEEKVSMYLILKAIQIHFNYRKKLLLEQKHLFIPL